MFACKRRITIKDPANVVLTDLPFRPGDKVEMLIFSESDVEGEESLSEKFRSLFIEIQSLPQSEEMTYELIDAEIQEYRKEA